MKKEWLFAFAFAWLGISCTGLSRSGTDELCIIDVGGAMENQTELKLSELGSGVRYVPLETNASCLIGANPSIMLLEDRIVVTFLKECLLFDKETGKFICKVGHAGSDPQAYTSNVPTYGDKDGSLYFLQGMEQLQKYDLKGNYCGKIKIPSESYPPSSFCITDRAIVGHYDIVMGNTSRSLLLFNENGEQIDTVPSVLPVFPTQRTQDIQSFGMTKKGNSTIMLIDYKDGSSSANIMGNSNLWKSDGRVRFKESYNDTIYTLQGKELLPYMVFSSGKWKSGIGARAYSGNSGKVLLFGCVYETPEHVFFQCFENYTEPFNGIYDREKGTTRMCSEAKGFTDDLTGFLPFRPRTCSLQGEYGNVVEAGDVLSWLEENPDKAGKEQFAALKELADDANPVVVITVPY